jgi:hypothetical protein
MGVRRSLAGIPAGVLGCSVALVLGACGGGDDSVADPPVSSTTSSPTESPQHESAEHFIRRFYAVEKAMENTGKTSDYAAMSDPCKPCSALVKQVRSIYKAGGFIHWKGLTIRSITGPGSGHTYTISFDARPTEYRDTAKGSIKTLPGGASKDRLTLSRNSQGWTVIARARTTS